MHKTVAVDIGGTYTKFALVMPDGSMEHATRFQTEPPLDNFIKRLRSVVIRLVEDGSRNIGVSVAGFLDCERSRMIYNPNIPWLEGFPLRETIESFQPGLRVALEVDSNAAAIGEYRFGSGGQVARFLFLSIGTGIGAGFLENGRVARIAYECIGDAGHVIVAPNGPRCSCGGVGCAEAVASAIAIERDLATFETAGMHIGVLAASLASIFFPDRIALGGGVCEASDIVVSSAQSAFATHAGDLARSKATVVKATLGAWAPLAGAAWVAAHTDN